MALLTINGLFATYGKIAALRGISLELGRGDRVALLGANGAGKTTTLEAASGTTAARLSGHVFLEGRDITRLPAHERVELGLVHVPEGRGIFTAMTVLENLEVGAFALRPRSSSSVSDALDRVMAIFPRLRERTHQRAGTLSGGEQQMLAIARGLMSSPKVLLFDEPSTGLSPAMIGLVFEALTKIADGGVGVLLVEQKVEAALRFASRAYVLSHGRVVLAGSSDAVREDRGLKEAYLGRR